MMDLTSLHSKLVAEVGELFFHLYGQGCKLCLVGGVTRDFFLTGELVKDIDVEVRSNSSIEELISSYPDKLNYEKLSYDIIKVYWNDFVVEFSPPRKETFIEGDFSHKNFTATIDQNLNYQQSFYRRDFTINAIGLEFYPDKLVLQDPYDGLSAIKSELVVPVSKDCSKDPVRFLRMIRFSLTLGFKIGDEGIAQMPQFNLQSLSTYYFRTEWKKSENANGFLQKIQHYIKKYKLIVPEWIKNFEPIDSEIILKTPHDYLVLSLWNDVYMHLENPQDYFEIGKGDFDALKNFIHLLRDMDWTTLVSLKGQDFDRVKMDPDFLQFHELTLLDRHERFSGNYKLQILPEAILGPFQIMMRKTVDSHQVQTINAQEKTLFKSYLRLQSF